MLMTDGNRTCVERIITGERKKGWVGGQHPRPWTVSPNSFTRSSYSIASESGVKKGVFGCRTSHVEASLIVCSCVHDAIYSANSEILHIFLIGNTEFRRGKKKSSL